jgi:hypothetical protein
VKKSIRGLEMNETERELINETHAISQHLLDNSILAGFFAFPHSERRLLRRRRRRGADLPKSAPVFLFSLALSRFLGKQRLVLLFSEKHFIIRFIGFAIQLRAKFLERTGAFKLNWRQGGRNTFQSEP